MVDYGAHCNTALSQPQKYPFSSSRIIDKTFCKIDDFKIIKKETS